VNPKLRIAYFGLPLAACLLIADGHELAFAVLPPVEGPGKRRLKRLLGPERIIEASEVGSALNTLIEARLHAEQPDLIVSWFWTRLIRAEWLEKIPCGGIGAHPSLLPRHRGPNPYFWAIDSGDVETGVTLHTLSAEYDTGDILLTRSILIGEANAWQLARALDRPSVALLREAAVRISRGEQLPRTPQLHTNATWAPEPDADLLRADFHWTTERVLRRIRAMSPVPGLALEIRGLAFFVTHAVKAESFVQALEPGEAGIIKQPPRVVVRTADGAIQLERALLPNEEAETEEDAGIVLTGESLAELVATRLAQSS
jgi:methionyl-tRNA formyltransferase